MWFVFPSPFTLVKSHEEKFQNYFRITTKEMSLRSKGKNDGF